MMLGADKIATTHKKRHTQVHSQTIALAMIDVRMQSHSKWKIDEFPSSQQNGNYYLDNVSNEQIIEHVFKAQMTPSLRSIGDDIMAKIINNH